MKQQFQKHAPRYGMAAGAGSLASYLATTVPGLRDMPVEVSVPLVLAAIHFVTEQLKARFKLPT